MGGKSSSTPAPTPEVQKKVRERGIVLQKSHVDHPSIAKKEPGPVSGVGCPGRAGTLPWKLRKNKARDSDKWWV